MFEQILTAFLMVRREQIALMVALLTILIAALETEFSSIAVCIFRTFLFDDERLICLYNYSDVKS